MTTALLPLAEYLRAATRTAHRQLDHHPLLNALVRKDLDLTRYGQVLASLHGPQAALEAVVRPRLVQLGVAQVFAPRQADLAADLSVLGLTPLPLYGEPPTADDDSALVGLLYVLEGSRLGGAVIARCLADSLPEPPRWARYWAFAADRIADVGQYERVGEAALAGFALFRRQLDACLREVDAGRAVPETR